MSGDKMANGKSRLKNYVVTVSVEHFRTIRAVSAGDAGRRAVGEAKATYGTQGFNVRAVRTERLKP